MLSVIRQRVVLILLLFISVFSAFTYSSEECRKELAAHLKEISENSGLYWALEFTGQLGIGTGVDALSRDSLFGAVEYNPGNGFIIYIEGGARYFTLSSEGQNKYGYDGWGYPDNKIRFRLKEGYIKYNTPDFEASAGLITATLGDFFLLDERAFGASIKINTGKFTIIGTTGSVVQNFTYGDKGWLKKSLVNWLDPEDFQEAGDKFGDSNFAGASIILYPGRGTNSENRYTAIENIQHQDEEFSEDEFDSYNEESSFIEKIGMIFNYEFGDEVGASGFTGIDRIYYGAFASFEIDNILHLNASAVFQEIESTRAIGWFIEGSRTLNLGSAGSLDIKAGYIGSDNIDGTIGFAPGFTHLAKGEVYGFEPSHAPLVILETVYRFPLESPWDLSLSYYARTDEASDKANELDFILKIPLEDGLRIYFFYSRVESNLTGEDIDYLGAEVRFTI